MMWSRISRRQLPIHRSASTCTPSRTNPQGHSARAPGATRILKSCRSGFLSPPWGVSLKPSPVPPSGEPLPKHVNVAIDLDQVLPTYTAISRRCTEGACGGRKTAAAFGRPGREYDLRERHTRPDRTDRQKYHATRRKAVGGHHPVRVLWRDVRPSATLRAATKSITDSAPFAPPPRDGSLGSLLAAVGR